MAFDTQERSLESGSPVELYEFQIGPDRIRYANAQQNLIYNAVVWHATPLDRSKIEETWELARQNVTIMVPADSDAANLFRYAPPSETVEVIIRRVHLTDTADQLVTQWFGRVLNCRWEGPIAHLTCESLVTSFRRLGLRRHYQRTCPHVLYGNSCGANPNSFKIEDEVLTVNGTTITVNDALLHADGYFAGGIVEWDKGTGRYERRTIRSHVGDTLVLTHAIPGLIGGVIVTVFAGCDHTSPTCDGKFNNIPNYGGWPIPRRNPFGQNGAF